MAPPSTPLAQAMGAYPSFTATAGSLKRSRVARTCSARGLLSAAWAAAPAADAMTKGDKTARVRIQRAAVIRFSRLQSIRTQSLQHDRRAWRGARAAAVGSDRRRRAWRRAWEPAGKARW